MKATKVKRPAVLGVLMARMTTPVMSRAVTFEPGVAIRLGVLRLGRVGLDVVERYRWRIRGRSLCSPEDDLQALIRILLPNKERTSRVDPTPPRRSNPPPPF